MARILQSIAIALFALGTPSASAQPAKVFKAEDMLAVRTFAGGQPIAASSTGRWIAYVLTDVDDEWNIQEPRPTGHVHVRPVGSDRSQSRALTAGTTHSAFPVWSPDGRRLAFVREESSGGRLVIWDADRDRLTPVGDPLRPRVYLAPQWTPDARRVIIAAPVPPSMPTPERVRVVKSTDVRIPGDQFFTDTRSAVLTTIDVATGVATPLAPEPIVLRSFRVSPSGKHLIYGAPVPETLGIIGKEQNDTFLLALDPARGSAAQKLTERARLSWSPGGDRLLFVKAGSLMAFPVSGGEAKPWSDSLKQPIGDPIWSPDGSRFATLVADPSVTDPEIEPAEPGMYTIAQPFMDLYIVSTDGSATNVTASFRDQVSEAVWAPDGKAIYFRAVDNETYDETIYRFVIADHSLQVIARGSESYGRLTAIEGGVIATVQSATRPEDLWVLGGNGRARVTDLNPQLAQFAFSTPELFPFHNADHERLGALLYKPAGMRPADKVPVITWVYEKMTPAIHRFNARDQMFISHGYAMLMPNVKVKVGRTADSFEKCVVPAVDAVRAMGFTNGRIGLWGHSFGAYAASNLITRTNIFAAAVSGATPPELFRNWASGRDRDSRNIETGQARMGGSPFEHPERYLSQSAFFHLDKVTTPVLILHGEKDLTILFGEGEMMFFALRQLGKEAEFVAYSNGDHSLSRHSRADALDVNRRILEWFDRYLKTPPRASSQSHGDDR